MQETADLITFAEEILNGKLHFLCSERRELAVPLKIYPTSVSTIEVRNSTVRFEVDLAGSLLRSRQNFIHFLLYGFHYLL